MNEVMIQNFTNQIFGNVRSIIINDEPWFVGSEIATILGYSRPADALSAHVKDKNKYFVKVGEMPTLNITSNYGAYIINEAGLYSLIMKSKLPAAEAFQDWVTSEVLPTMRKIGFSHSMEILKAENERLKGLNNKLTKENYELNTAYNGLQQSFTNQSVDFAFNTDARNQIIEKIMSVSWLTPEQKQFLIKYEGE